MTEQRGSTRQPQEFHPPVEEYLETMLSPNGWAGRPRPSPRCWIVCVKTGTWCGMGAGCL